MAKYVEDCGFDRVSEGQKVNIILDTFMLSHPHTLILDEPTNYLDHDALSAFESVIDNVDDVVMIIGNNN